MGFHPTVMDHYSLLCGLEVLWVIVVDILEAGIILQEMDQVLVAGDLVASEGVVSVVEVQEAVGKFNCHNYNTKVYHTTTCFFLTLHSKFTNCGDTRQIRSC